MKRIAAILFLILAAVADAPLHAADLVVSNNSIWCLFSDSTQVDDDSAHAGNITGYRFEAYVHSYLALNYPQGNIQFYNFSKSGGLMNDEIIAAAADGLVTWGSGSNAFQHIGIGHATENGSLNSNQMYLDMSLLMQAPGTTTNGTAMTNEIGWSAVQFVQWIGMGALPQEGATGDGGTVVARNGAGTNAGWALGIRGVDLWGALSHSWTNDYNANGGTNVGWFAAPKVGHPGAGGDLNWAFAFIKSISTDTNISTCIVDYAGSGAVVDTNHCIISGVSKTGNTLSFIRHDDRLPMAWDYPDGVITNNASGAFNLDPTDADHFKFTLQVTNLPTGNYIVTIDGAVVATLTNTALAAGWNMFTNTTGPYWNQRKEVLRWIRVLEYVDAITLKPGSAGDGVGLVSLASNIGARWIAGDRGEKLRTNATLVAKMAQVQTNFTAIHNAAQPTNHTFTIAPAFPTPRIVPSATTVALRVPVILDASQSLLATTFLWSQTNGSPQLDMIGLGTAKPMLIGVTNAGTYTFQLIVTDGSSYGTNAVTITFVEPSGGHTNYVDQTLPANCLSGNYSFGNRNSSGSDGNAWTNLQQAANAASAGDLILIRSGIYTNTPAVGNQTLCLVTNHGTVTAPIRFEAYNGESVVLRGWGFSDADANSDGFADGPTYPLWRQTLFWVATNADYIQVRGIEMTNCQQSAMNIQASFCYVSECNAHDNWFTGIGISRADHATNTLQGSVIQSCEASYNRHFTGILIGLESQQTLGFVSDCAIVDCLSYRNGYTRTAHVLPIGGDPQGGGNADGFSCTKYAADNAIFNPGLGVVNFCTNLYFCRNISELNSDDGVDTSCSDSTIDGNRSLFNGPTGTMGFKMFRPVQNMVYRGNFAFGNQGRGFEMRYTNSIKVFNNTSVQNQQYGFWGLGTIFTTNNVAAFNGQADWPNAITPNWGEDGINVPVAYRGDPVFLDTNLTVSTTFDPALTTVKQRYDAVEAAFAAHYSPATNSPLLRAGLYIPGYHCVTADDDAVNPAPAGAPGRHWSTTYLFPLGAYNPLSTNIPPPPPAPALPRFGFIR